MDEAGQPFAWVSQRGLKVKQQSGHDLLRSFQ